MRITRSNLRAAADALGAVLSAEGAADRALSAWFRGHRELGQDDRAVVAETAFAVLRRLRTVRRVADAAQKPTRRMLDRMVAAALVGPLGHNAREVAAGGILEIEEVEALRGRWHAPEAAGPAEALDLPDWLWPLLADQYGEAAAGALGRSLLDAAPLDLRVNVARTSREALLAEFTASGIHAAPTPFAPYGIRMAGKPALNRHPAFLDGRFEVQDEASQLICHLVGPRRGEMVVDFCAGAGGKTLAMAALMRSTGRIYALDVSARRLERLKARVARAGASNVHVQVIAGERDPKVKRLAGKIDRVLVDAPCSGFGTLRRNPELKWRQQAEDVAELAVRQRSLLEGAARLAKPGGLLVYATCSLLGAENEEVANRFLADHAEYRLEDARALLAAERIVLPLDQGGSLRLVPHVHHTDGFFAAAFRRLP